LEDPAYNLSKLQDNVLWISNGINMDGQKLPIPKPSFELYCQNGLDDDGDGLIDAADADCPSEDPPPGVLDLEVTKAASTAEVTAGSDVGNLSYVVTVVNRGPADATGVEIIEDLTALPDDVSVESVAPSQGTFSDDT
jgi:uncharacterized repeat protein (TIGR01451 family)